MESLEEQLKNKCIHFTGLMNGSCKLGIKYKDVREGPLRFPCVKPEITTCDSRKHHTDEDVRKFIDEIKNSAGHTLNLLFRIKALIKLTQQLQGTISCECGGKAHWTAAAPNGHIWFQCPQCHLTFNE